MPTIRNTFTVDRTKKNDFCLMITDTAPNIWLGSFNINFSFKMSTASSDKPVQHSTILDKFNAECSSYVNSELNTRLLTSSSTDKSAISSAYECYLAEYQRCIDEQMSFVNYINEQMASLDGLKES
jgi:hypothetical protein